MNGYLNELKKCLPEGTLDLVRIDTQSDSLFEFSFANHFYNKLLLSILAESSFIKYTLEKELCESGVRFIEKFSFKPGVLTIEELKVFFSNEVNSLNEFYIVFKSSKNTDFDLLVTKYYIEMILTVLDRLDKITVSN